MKNHIFSLLAVCALLAAYSATTNLSLPSRLSDKTTVNHVLPVARSQTNDGMMSFINGNSTNGWGDPIGRETIAQGWGDPVGRGATVWGWGDPIG